MPKTLQEIIDHADDMSTAFDDYQPEANTLRDPAPLLRARAAVHARARAEAEVAAAVAEMRDTEYSWAAIGMVLGTTGEAARQRYGGAPTESVPALRAAEPGPMAASRRRHPAGRLRRPRGVGPLKRAFRRLVSRGLAERAFGRWLLEGALRQRKRPLRVANNRLTLDIRRFAGPDSRRNSDLGRLRGPLFDDDLEGLAAALDRGDDCRWLRPKGACSPLKIIRTGSDRR